MESSKTCRLTAPGAAREQPSFAGARTAVDAAALHMLIFIHLRILSIRVENMHPSVIKKREQV